MDYSLHYRKWHDGSKEHFDATAGFYRNLLGPVLEKAPKSSRVLDVGCGQGLLVYALGKLGFSDVQGIDLSEQQITVAREHGLACKPVDREYIVDLATKSPCSFELVFMMDVLEHVNKAEQLQILAAVNSLLSPGGKLILSTPNANSSFAMTWRHIDWTHETSFTEHSLEFVLWNSGFSKVQFLPYEFFARPRLAFIPRKSVVPWALLRFFRILRRLEAVGEMGEQGWNIPLSLNLLAQCVKE